MHRLVWPEKITERNNRNNPFNLKGTTQTADSISAKRHSYQVENVHFTAVLVQKAK